MAGVTARVRSRMLMTPVQFRLCPAVPVALRCWTVWRLRQIPSQELRPQYPKQQVPQWCRRVRLQQL